MNYIQLMIATDKGVNIIVIDLETYDIEEN
jgi:hypothetical protein